MKCEFKLGDKSKTRKEKIAAIVLNSRAAVKIFESRKGICLSLQGKAKDIPSMKNSKIPNTNFLNPNILCRIKALDILFKRLLRTILSNSFPTKESISLIILNGKRNVNFDPIGCLETIQDWLEPDTKKVGKSGIRGWGVGLIENDSQVVFGVSLRKKDLGMTDIDSTEIYIYFGLVLQQDIFKLINRRD